MRTFFNCFCYGCGCCGLLLALSPNGGRNLLEFAASMAFLMGSGFVVHTAVGLAKDIYDFWRLP
jgi:hypothetical protein